VLSRSGDRALQNKEIRCWVTKPPDYNPTHPPTNHPTPTHPPTSPNEMASDTLRLKSTSALPIALVHNSSNLLRPQCNPLKTQTQIFTKTRTHTWSVSVATIQIDNIWHGETVDTKQTPAGCKKGSREEYYCRKHPEPPVRTLNDSNRMCGAHEPPCTNDLHLV